MGVARRRVVGITNETTQGTHNAPAAADAIPMLRGIPTFTPTAVEVERDTIRLSLTDIGNIFPGKSTVQIDVGFELTANSAYVSGAGVTSAMRPMLHRVMQACGYFFVSEGALVYAYALTSIAGTAGLRHGETITGASTAGVGNLVVGDTYGDDGVLFVDHGSTPLVGSPFTGQTSGAVATVGARNVTEIFAWYPQSTLPDGAGAGQKTASITVWADGKRLQAKGCMGEIVFEFNHGDAVVCRSTFQGIVVDYTDNALPTAPNEAHKYPPTFLGTRVTLRQTVNAPTSANKYGSDGGGTGVITGSLSQMRLNTGNNIVLRPNSMDPNGINYAIIGDREPGGSFNPDEVLNANFNFVSRFVSGTPLRLRTTVNGPGTSVPLFNDPSTHNQNSYAFLAPGILFDGMTDGDRDNLQILDSSFKLTGGDYDTTDLGEAPGNDNEFVLVHF